MKPNSGNGGNFEKYYWEQSLNELTVYWYLPDGTRAKDLKVDMSIPHCKIIIKDQTVIDMPWNKPIRLDDSLWCIEADKDGRRCLQLAITKKDGQNWWDCVW